MTPKEFRACFFFAGLGAGALGFIRALGKLGDEGARFVSVGAFDNDPLACADFEYLTGSPATVADLSKITPAEIRAVVGDVAPDCIFMSSPCKGLSSLLSSKQADSEKYQAMNRLVLTGIFLACETWKRPPGLLVLENVPRIRTRGKHLLIQAKALLAQYGYVFHEATHELGEVGGLGQIRRRYLLVARQPSIVPAYVYRPPKQRVKACGEILAALPIPGDPAAGSMHQLPKISWLNWLRLALIPAGGDWRDLPGATPKDPEARRRWEQDGVKTAGETHLFKGKHGVLDFGEPARSVIGGPSNGASNVADPRVPRSGALGVTDWNEPSRTVIGESYPSNGSASVADPRVPLSAGEGAHTNIMAVASYDQPSRTVTGAVRPGAGALSVADPRIPLGAPGDQHQPGTFGVDDWTSPAPAVTGSMRVTGSNTPAAIGDPRIPGLPFGNVDRVTGWDQPTGTITASPAPSSGAAAVADPRLAELVSPVPEGAERRSVFMRYDVRSWDDPARTVAGPGVNGGFGVADPRAVDQLAEAVAMKQGDGWSEDKPGLMGVNEWDKPTRAVVGKASISGGNGVAAVADPRGVGLSDSPARHWNKYNVDGWDGPAQTVTGSTRPGSGAGSVADPREVTREPWRGHLGVIDWRKPAPTVRSAQRVSQGAVAIADPRLNCQPRAGVYGILEWQQAAKAITGNARIDNGSFAVADPRFPEIVDPKKEKPDFVPVIIAEDGTWHRPLTTLELAALQGLPATVRGEPLQLAGKAVGKWRERVGNAVPVQAATAIAETLLKALLAAALGTWSLGSTGIWVRSEDGLTEDEINAEMVA